jgi:hypothetical protein
MWGQTPQPALSEVEGAVPSSEARQLCPSEPPKLRHSQVSNIPVEIDDDVREEYWTGDS